jgi:hypothetical protein
MFTIKPAQLAQIFWSYGNIAELQSGLFEKKSSLNILKQYFQGIGRGRAICAFRRRMARCGDDVLCHVAHLESFN